jgi:nucleotidyltransferase/DNA polymerase involved in DNA repair
MLSKLSSMPISSEALKRDLDRLTNEQLKQVADFIDFLKFRDQRRHKIVIDPSQLESLATEFNEEDRALAETGMSDYAAMLEREDNL